MEIARFKKHDSLAVFIDFTQGPLRSVKSIAPQEIREDLRRFRRALDLMEVPCLFAEAPLPPPLGDWIPEASVQESMVVRHSTNDCFETREFAAAVESSGRKNLILTGIATDVGVGLTALSALQRGYEVAVIVDTSGTTDTRCEQAAFLRLSHAGVALSGWSAMMGELQGDYTTSPGQQLLSLMNFGPR